MSLIELDKSVIPAYDISSLDKLCDIIRVVSQVKGIGGHKVGLELVIPFGLESVVKIIKDHSDLPVIYDHQKGATDIPELGPKFMKVVKSAGADAAIIFPFGGAETQEAWIKSAQDNELAVIVGGHMTQKRFLNREGGYIADDAPLRIYQLAAELGVTDFVVPGNKPEFVTIYRELLEKMLGAGNFSLYAPGFISQGGDITETGKIAGDKWHAIVGGAIYKQEGDEKIRAAAQKLTAQIIN